MARQTEEDERNKMWRMKVLMKKVRENDTLNGNLSDMRKGSNSKHERKNMFVVLLENKQNSPVLTGFTASLYYISHCMYLCMLPFFSTTADPFEMKLSQNLCYGTGQPTKHFGARLMHI